ncbi:MAG: Cna B-type domain-containing protein, partial [Methanosphaera sp.]|nr:Cna B-type domain-containing protein [Methanosphaera sp.]
MERSYTQAKDDAATLASKVGKDNFYTIFAYGASYGSDYMTDITSDAGAPSGNNYSASNTAALQAAFAEILNKIEMAGCADITIEDGTTHRLESTAIELLDVVPNSFKYYKDGVEWKTTDNPAPPAATYNEETGKVEWKIDGLLDNGVTYKVTFDVYPTQETYDIIADIKNESTLQARIDKYNELPVSVRQYLTPTNDQYTDFKLATNTQAILKYKDTRVSNTEQTAIFDPPKPVSTEAETISIKKNWKNLLDSRSVNSIQLSLNRDGVDFLDATLTGPDWKKENIYIATGLMRTHTKPVDGEEITELEILDEGHDYKFNELGSEAYNWDLESEVVHPMIIDGTLWELVLVDEDEAPNMGNSQYKKVGEDEYYQLEDGKVYIKKGTNLLIEATNNRRSSLNITKVVEAVEGTTPNPDDKFKFTIDVDNLETKEVNDTNNDDLWFNVRDKNGNNVTFDEEPEGWTQEAGSTYYYAPNGTTLEVELKAGDNLRFTNLKVGSKFTVVEGDLDKYSIKKIEFIENYKENETDEEETENIIDTINNNKTIANKTIDEDNRTYTVKYTNTYERVDVKVKKVWIDETNDGVKPDEVTAKLLYSDDTEVQGAAVATMNEDNNWEYTWKGLDRYKNGEEITYKVKELVEDISAHYESKVEGSMKTGFTITNTRDENDKTTERSVKKVWEDANNQDGKQ